MENLHVAVPQSSDSAQQDLARHACNHDGCGRSFIRKEHLTRHLRSHQDSPSHVCPVCQRAFTRNDVLSRHLSRHARPVAVMTRNNRACDRCHSSKIRCDGGRPCSHCLKRGNHCKDERGGQKTRESTPTFGSDASDGTGQGMLLGDAGMASKQATNNDLGVVPVDVHQMDVDPNSRSPKNALLSQEMQARSQNTPEFLKNITDVPALLQYDLGRLLPKIVANTERLPPMFPTPVTSEHARLYFKHFHHRWPIIHQPGYEEDKSEHILTGSVSMIGAWLEDTDDSRALALTMHEKFFSHLMGQLTACYDDLSKKWPITLFQTSLLNIIFGLYSGKEKFIAKAMAMRGTLLSILREFGFFKREIERVQEKPTEFLPYRQVRSEERKRLATCLFKVDHYFSLMECQPPALRSEEMHFALPCTFCTFSAPGLLALQSRMACEPIERDQQALCDSLLRDVAFSECDMFPNEPVLPYLLVEDIQIALCSIQERLWIYKEQQHHSNSDMLSGNIQYNSLNQRLKFWKRKLDEVYLTYNVQDMLSVPMRYYHGLEDFSTPGWASIVSDRPISIYFDTLMLYHLLHLHLHADVNYLQLLASQYINNANSAVDKEPIEEKIKAWTQLPSARRALWHTTEIIARHYEWQPRLNTSIIDPINHITLTTAGLLIWGFAKFGQQKCTTCDPSFGSTIPVDLLQVDASEMIVEQWITKGGPASFGELDICTCNLWGLISKVRPFLPKREKSWELANKYIFPDFRAMFTHFQAFGRPEA